jgi:MerR family transcriptional regulator, mercuric resistance operon regulatory protein
MRKVMTVGQLAEAAGVGVETVRYYQRRGLLPKPAKPLAGRRNYGDDALQRIRFVRRAQHLGFTLQEITLLLAIADGGTAASGRAMAQAKVDELTQRIGELERMRRTLRSAVKLCDASPRGAPCPFIESLQSDDD